ncbi:MAG: hypothetical protein ACHQQQ_12880 [Bacteroidota bacterium]
MYIIQRYDSCIEVRRLRRPPPAKKTAGKAGGLAMTGRSNGNVVKEEIGERVV